jgi:hypothetical protein
VVFYLCPSCDHGQCYCSPRCRQKSRRQQRREANRRHQQSPEGRLDHRDRQREYRRRRSARVTDQGSQPQTASGRMTAPAPPPRAAFERRAPEEGFEPDLSLPLCCWRCGRRGEWIHPFARENDP